MFLFKRKESTYYIQYLDPVTGKARRKSTHTKSKKEALKFLKDFDPNSKPIKQLVYLSKFKEEYVNYVTSNKTKKYVKSINLSFRQLLAYSKDIPLQNLSIRLLDQFISERYATAPWSALMYYRTLKASFTKAVVWGYIDENPLKKIEPPRQKKLFPSFYQKRILN